jgi:putative transposase
VHQRDPCSADFRGTSFLNIDLSEEGGMRKKRYTPEQIVGMLREVEAGFTRKVPLGEICRRLGITVQTYYRWRREYDGLKLSQAKRLKELQRENSRLKRAVAELTLDKLVLKEALEGNS